MINPGLLPTPPRAGRCQHCWADCTWDAESGELLSGPSTCAGSLSKAVNPTGKCQPRPTDPVRPMFANKSRGTKHRK